MAHGVHLDVEAFLTRESLLILTPVRQVKIEDGIELKLHRRATEAHLGLRWVHDGISALAQIVEYHADGLHSWYGKSA